MTDRTAKICIAHYKKAIAQPDEYIKYALSSESNAKIWYVMLHNFSGDEDEYVGGEYIVRVEFPENFPFSPPSFYFMTPNGVYGVEQKVCIDIGEYHKDNYRAALGASGFCKQLTSGFIGWRTLGGGINILHTSVNEKTHLSADSKDFNKKNNAEIVAKIDEAYENYSAVWTKNTNNNNNQ